MITREDLYLSEYPLDEIPESECVPPVMGYDESNDVPCVLIAFRVNDHTHAKNPNNEIAETLERLAARIRSSHKPVLPVNGSKFWINSKTGEYLGICRITKDRPDCH